MTVTKLNKESNELTAVHYFHLCAFACHTSVTQTSDSVPDGAVHHPDGTTNITSLHRTLKKKNDKCSVSVKATDDSTMNTALIVILILCKRYKISNTKQINKQVSIYVIPF